jgi:hypothetical protein
LIQPVAYGQNPPVAPDSLCNTPRQLRLAQMRSEMKLDELMRKRRKRAERPV